MRPILLKGHERAITFVRYNKEGDLLFSCAKDGTPCAWYSDNGERLGTFEGHTGAVWMLDVSYDSKYLVTASADMSVRLFAVETGECLKVLQHPGPTRACCFAEGGRHFATGANPFRGEDARLRIYEIPEDVSKMSDA